jgi:hypothetical protein
VEGNRKERLLCQSKLNHNKEEILEFLKKSSFANINIVQLFTAIIFQPLSWKNDKDRISGKLFYAVVVN